MTSFTDFSLPAALCDELARQGITTPFPIQVATLPDTLAGKDVLGRGRTGSGKTLAFALPLVTRLAATNSRRAVRVPRALVLCPTRELANQIDATLAPLARSLGLVTTVIYGGVTQRRQVSALNGGVDIVIACPGRLEDLLQQKALTLEAVEVSVIDEADHMAELGFLPGVRRIMKKTPRGSQRLLFSATLDHGVDELVDRFLDRPVTHVVESPRSSGAAMTHHVLAVPDPGEKAAVVARLASGTGRRVLFTRTRLQAKKLAKILTAQGIPRSSCTATSRRTCASATSRPSPRGSSGCWSPRTWPPAASTSTASSSWSTWTRPPSTSPTCTGRVGRLVPGARVTW